MRGIATLAAALFVGLGAAATQETPEGEAAPKAAAAKGGWFGRWWPFGHKEEKKAEHEHAHDHAHAPEPESPALVRAREEAALQRRQAVCLQLQTIAIKQRDDTLLRKVEELERMAWDTYVQRTSHLPSGGALQADEQALGQHLGPRGGDGHSLPLTASRDMTTDGGHAARREP